MFFAKKSNGFCTISNNIPDKIPDICYNRGMEFENFTISPKVVDKIAKIAEMVGELHGAGEYKRNLRLRKINRLRSIQSSLAIEANSLSLAEVQDVIDGKAVLGSPREIQEVKNAYAAYDNLMKYEPYNVEDFLLAHRLMSAELVRESGEFRRREVGVFKGTELVHRGAPAVMVPRLINELFDWAKNSDLHPLIKSSVMHFEIEYIHPFADGNGRMGRLWQTVILAHWEPMLAWLPVETIVYERQQAYYDSLHTAEMQADAGGFIEFMVDAIYDALIVLPMQRITDIFPDKITDKLTKTEMDFLEEIIGFLERNGEITNYRAQLLTNKSPENIRKIFNNMVEKGVFVEEGDNKGRKYKIDRKHTR